jgi:4'-phosphopantetheinyl transferase
VAVAVSDEPIGIDIETIRPYKDDLARHVLSDSEYESVVSSSKPDVEFIKLWTRKEAVLKLSGEGIRRDLRTLLTGQENTETIVDEVKGYVCTIAMK